MSVRLVPEAPEIGPLGDKGKPALVGVRDIECPIHSRRIVQARHSRSRL